MISLVYLRIRFYLSMANHVQYAIAYMVMRNHTKYHHELKTYSFSGMEYTFELVTMKRANLIYNIICLTSVKKILFVFIIGECAYIFSCLGSYSLSNTH